MLKLATLLLQSYAETPRGCFSCAGARHSVGNSGSQQTGYCRHVRPLAEKCLYRAGT